MSTRDVLLDTGPIVAALDPTDQWHQRCVAIWPDMVDRCVTSEAVVTEACYLVQWGGGSTSLPLDFLLAAGIPILGLSVELHRQAARLISLHGDLPMNYADATLVMLASALHIDTVFTTDRKGFRRYRQSPDRSFEILPP